MSDDSIEKACREWCKTLRAGCLLTYMGGHTGEMYEAFTHGMETVCNELDASLTALVRDEYVRGWNDAVVEETKHRASLLAENGRVEGLFNVASARIAALEAQLVEALEYFRIYDLGKTGHGLGSGAQSWCERTRKLVKP